MNDLKDAIMAICAVSAVRCIVRNISSSSELKNQVEMIMNLIFAIVITAPFVNGFSGFELPDVSQYSFSGGDFSDGLYFSVLTEQTEKNIEGVLSDQLEAVGVPFEKIEVEVNILSDGSIFINRVTVTSQSFDEAAEIVRNMLGSETEVVNGAD